MTLPRSFWDKAEKTARKFRKELAIADTAVVDVAALAALAGVELIDGADLIGREPFEDLNKIQYRVFGAATFEVAGRTFIVTNPLANEMRRRADVAHELGHILLGHKLTSTRQIGDVSVGICTPEQGQEATALGDTLLLPRRTIEAMLAGGVNTDKQLALKQKVPYSDAALRLETTGLLENSHLTNKTLADRHPYA